METSNSRDASNFKPSISSTEPHLDLYTIPSYSSWFSWSNIHEIERISLREFFDGSSITRTPRIYKEYRDFIISKYREDSSRSLTFTELRKSLVGDVSMLQKVFTFLEKWGLINFSGSISSCSATGASTSLVEGLKEDDKWNIRVEEGPPHGVRVVGAPNSLKPVTAPPTPSVVDFSSGAEVAEIGSKFPPLASYSDIYEELMHQQQKQLGKESLVCRSCKDCCDSGHYEYVKDGSVILCKKCIDNKNYEKDKSIDDFKFVPSQNQGVVWTEAETLLLLESVLKHGDDWELVAQHVKTKSKIDCISKLLQLPFGDLMLGSAFGKNKIWDISGHVNSVGKELSCSSGPQQINREGHDQEQELNKDNEIVEEQEPPRKKLCTVPASDASSALMKQVARLSSVVGPQITAAAAEAAVAELCYENRCTREILDEENFCEETRSSPQSNNQERDPQPESLVGQTQPNETEIKNTAPQKNVVSLTLRMRVATATALGAAAAHAKILANQEERQIEHIVTTIIETQKRCAFHMICEEDEKNLMMICKEDEEDIMMICEEEKEDPMMNCEEVEDLMMICEEKEEDL